MWVEVEVTTTKTHLVELDMEILDVSDIPVAKEKACSIVEENSTEQFDSMESHLADYWDVVRYADKVYKL